MAITTNGLQLVRLAGAVFNQQLSASDYSEILASSKTAAELDAWANAAVAAEFRNKTTTDIAKAVLANVGLSSVTGLEAWVAGQLTAGGGVAKAGATMLSLLNDYSNMSTTEAIYGASVMTFNQKVANSQALSQTAGTATGTYAAISTTATAAVFPLTTGADVKTLGSGNDTINALYASATGMTFQATDSLDGGTGSDTINIQVGVTGTHAAASMVGIETVSANFSAAGTVALLGSTGVTTVESSASTAAAAFTNIGSTATALRVTNTGQDANFGFTTAAVAGTTSDAATVTLSAVSGGTVTLAGIELVTLASTGSANTLTALAATSATTVNVSGDQALTLGTLGSTVTTLNAGTNTATGLGVSATMGAAATATITGGTGNDLITISAITGDVSIIGGAGNDTVTVTANLTTTDTIGGGDGIADVLSTTAAIAEGYSAPTTRTITGFEQLTLSTASSAGVTLTTANVDTGITRVNLAGTGGAHGITGPAGALTVTSTAALGGTLTLTDTGTATSDAATLTNSGILNVNVLGGAAVTSTGYETLNINVGSASTANAAAQTLGAVTVTVDTGGASAVNFTGGNSLTTTGAVSATTISASGMTGSAALTLGSATGATSITGTANNDSIGASSVAASVTAGAGADTITGGTLNDTINGGDGNDSITGAVGKDSLTGGAGVDTFVFAANASLAVVSNQSNVDVITDFTSGTDKLSITNITSGAASKFLGNYANFTSANAAAAADGTAGLAFFVTGENNLYVQAAAGTQGVNDTVINLAGVTSLTAADLLLGAQGTGNTIVLVAATIPVVSTTASNATSSVLSTAFDDTFTSAASTALVGIGASLTGGAGNDTLNSTISVQGAVLSLTSSALATGVALSGVEVANFTVTASTGVLNVGTLPTDLKTITATATDLNGALQATTSAAGQTVTVTNTLGTNASAITVGNFSNQTVTTGLAGDGVTVNGGALSNYISVNTGTGNDTITLGALTALTGTNNVLNGSTGTDTLAFYGLSSLEAVNLATLITAGTIAGFEAVTFADGNDSAHAITAATGIVSYTANPSASAAEIYNISATAAQANAITTIANGGSATGLVNLLITSAGDVSFVADTTTAINLISYQDVAVNLTLNDTANAVTQGATTAGTAAQTVTFSAATAVAQTVTINNTGTVAFNLSPAMGVLLTAGAVADITPIAVTGATVSLNWVGTAGTIIDINDVDLQIGVSGGGVEDNSGANLDVINVGGVVGAQSFTYGTGLAATATRVTIPVNATETGATQYSYTFVTDNAGTTDQTLAITGFDAGTSGDKILLSNAANAIGASAVFKIATTSYTYNANAIIAAGAEANILVLQAASMQVSGALDQITAAGAVQAAIFAGGLISGSANAAVSTYIVLDNGVDTGIYRVDLDASATSGVVDTAAEIISVVLVATLVGVSDCSALVGANFA